MNRPVSMLAQTCVFLFLYFFIDKIVRCEEGKMWSNNIKLLLITLMYFLLLIHTVNADISKKISSSENVSFTIDAIGWNNDFYLIALTEYQLTNKSIEVWQKKLEDIAKSGGENVAVKALEKLQDLQTFEPNRGLLKYDGVRFEDLSKEANLSELSVTKIKWNGEYFLIAGDNGGLIKYDGKFQDLTSQLGWGFGIQILELIPSGELWLIYGVSWANEMVLVKKFDGNNFEDVSSSLGWELIPLDNGSYWFICSDKMGICEYDGKEIKKLIYFSTEEKLTPRIVGWNGKYLLLEQSYIEDGSKHSKLLTFDGNKIREINFSFGSITKIAWNGNYWVVNYYSGNNYRFGKIYEDKFVEVSALLNTSASALVCSGSYCLVSYRCGGVYGFNGTHFENLTESLREAGAECADKIAWDGNFWLLLQQNSRATVLLKYNGAAFEDLTPQLLKVLSEQSAGDKNVEIARGKTKEKAVCGPTLILLLPILLLLARRHSFRI